MQTLKTKQALARWRDRGWTYHGADSHHHSHDFYQRQIERGLQPRDAAPVRVIGQRKKA
jgi:hypothetical protein